MMKGSVAEDPRKNRERYGGYEFHFVSTPPDIVMCVICHLPSKNPYLSECCGHNFCKSCLRHCNTIRNAARACPMCKDKQFNTFPNKQIDREVRSLHVYCSNMKSGCTWRGEINEIADHLSEDNGCQYEEVPCPLNCTAKMQRRLLTEHVKDKCTRRNVACQYCQGVNTHHFIEGEHKNNCPKFPLTCPNRCKIGTVPREDMEAHRKSCPLEIIQCDYHSVGCEVRVTRLKRRLHEEEHMEEHLRMTKAKLAKTEETLQSTEERVNNLEVMLSRLIQNSTGSGMVIVETDWASHLRALATKSPNALPCPVIIKLSQFTCHLQSGKRWYSDPFYTYENGHKMCLSTQVNRDSGILSVWLHLMKGPNDDNLAWPLRGKFEIKLLNQTGDYKHHCVMLTYDDKVDGNSCGRITDEKVTIAKGYGYSPFFSLPNLQEISKACQFLKGNCLFFQVRSYIK